jgi:hypothetical protein
MENRREEQPQNGRNLRRRERVPLREEDEERYGSGFDEEEDQDSNVNNRRHGLFIKLVRFILFGSLKNYSNLSGFSMAFLLTYQTEFPPPFMAFSLYQGSCLS